MRLLVHLLAVFLVTVQQGGSAHPWLLFANRKDIRLVDATQTRSRNSNVTIIIKDLEDAAALDYHYEKGMVCWTDISLEMIRCAYHQGANLLNKTNVITTGLVSPDGLAIDWLGNKLYWTDSETNRLEVSTLNGENRKVLFWEDLDQPRAICLFPKKGLLFWTDWGENPKIESAGMNGDLSTRHVIIKDEIFWPNGLTIDYEEEAIFWADAKLNIICTASLSGANRRTVSQGDLQHPFALTMFKNVLYWTDWQTKSIHSCNKKTGTGRKAVLGSSLTPMDIHVYDQERQPFSALPCQNQNAKCSHLCLSAPYPPWFTCACPTGSKLVDNFTCADGAQQLLLLARRTDLRRISLDTPDYTDVVLPLDGVKHAIAVDYDPVDGFVYWSDDEVRGIRRAKLDGSQQEDVVMAEVDHPDGIAVDWIGRNLYWTDTGTDRIEVARLNGTWRKVLISENLDEPRALALDPEVGWMFWTDWGKEPKIERASMDGSDRLVLVNTSLGWPNGIALDYVQRRLYWCDAKTDKIEVADMDGSKRKEILSENVPHIFGFSLLGDFLYWTDWQHRSIERVHKWTGEDRKIIVDQLPDLMGLKAINITEVRGTNPCAVGNGGCSHLCLNRPGKFVCACPIGYELTADEINCVIPEAFLLFTRKDDIRRISLEANHKNVIIPIAGVKEASALDFDVNDNRIYWTDIGVKSISRAFMNGSNLEVVVEFGLEYPEGMAVDWVAHNIYWADMGSHRVEVARLDGSSRRVLIWKDLKNPRSIALDPGEGYMYLGVWGSVPHIERAGLDGSQRITLVNGVGRVNGLVVDFATRRLYWADVDGKHIESCDLDGKHRQVVVSGNMPQPHGLTLYEEFIYWADWTTRSIERAHKQSGENRTRIQTQVDFVMDILVFHSSRQSGWNPCAVNNGGCSHLCLALPAGSSGSSSPRTQTTASSTTVTSSSSSALSTATTMANLPAATVVVRQSHTHRCTCPTHYELVADNKTCVAPKSFLLFSQKNYINRLLPSSPDSPDMILPIRGLKQVRGIEFDPVAQHLYWIDGRSQTIRRALDNGTQASLVVPNPAQSLHPYDLAIEPFSRVLFWSCSRFNAINATRIDNQLSVGMLVGGPSTSDKPRNIAVHPVKGWLFFTNLLSPARIERCRLDGSDRIKIIETDIEQPSALTIDTDEEMIFWADTSLKVIEVAALDGTNRRKLVVSQLVQPIALTVHGRHLYWLEKDSQVIERALKSNGEDRQRVQERIPYLSDLLSTSTLDHNSLASNPCYPPNSGCGHLCVLMDSGERGRCACPLNMVLEDGKTCIEPPACSPEHFTCRSGIYETGPSGSGATRCIPLSWRCDGQTECSDASDEEDCPECRPDQFRCQTGQCIAKKHECDGVPHCMDRSDEQRCCPLGQFYCSELCLPDILLCDGVPHCPDESDESVISCANRVTNPLAGDSSKRTTYIIGIVVGLGSVALLCFLLFCWRRRHHSHADPDEGAHDPLNPTAPRHTIVPGHAQLHTDYQLQYVSNIVGERTAGVGAPSHLGSSAVDLLSGRGVKNGGAVIVDGGCVAVGSNSSCQLYDRSHVTGASSSSSSGPGYPQETLNPPPSPATDTRSHCTEPYCCTAVSGQSHKSHTMSHGRQSARGHQHHQGHQSRLGGTPSQVYSTLRSYKHYKMRNQPPPPTPCSTDNFEESDSQVAYHSSPSPSSIPKMGPGFKSASRRQQSSHRHQRLGADYDSDPYPPPPTPARSHYVSDASCPPSPSTERSYFNPLPPPPSPSPQ